MTPGVWTQGFHVRDRPHRALAEAEGATADEGLARRSKPARITDPGSGTDSELMQRLTRQVLDGTNDEVMELLGAWQDEGDAE